VLAALVLCACAAAQLPDPAPQPELPEHELREFSLQAGFVTGTLSIPAAPPGPKPAVLQPISDEHELLARGYVVVRYQTHWRDLAPLAAQAGEAPPAGEPAPATAVGKWMLAAPRPGLVGRAYFELIAATASTIVPAVIAHLGGVPEIDPRRVAISGSSTGGFVALEALIQEPRLAAAAVRVACGDYHEFLESSSLALAGDERWLVDGELALDPDYEASLRGREPIRFADRFPPRPLLLLNGALDPAVPAACARETARVLREAYEQRGVPERFRFVLYEDRGHDLGPDAEREILAWWDRWL
jgi:predicted esterase